MSLWESLLATNDLPVLPWTGGPFVTNGSGRWRISGSLPRVHGWYPFQIRGKNAIPQGNPVDCPSTYGEDRKPVKGWLVGDRLVPDSVKVAPSVTALLNEWAVTRKVFLLEQGLEVFTRVLAVPNGEALVYTGSEFPLGPEPDVLNAYQDRKDSVTSIPNVPPALDLAFRLASFARYQAEENRRQAEEQIRLEEERRVREGEARRLIEQAGTADGRRRLALVDFEAACKAALAITGATFLGARNLDNNQAAVRYLFQGERLECVVDRRTLGVLDAGVCLTNERTGERGDRRFTLESLPSVIGEAIEEGVLVVWRRG